MAPKVFLVFSAAVVVGVVTYFFGWGRVFVPAPPSTTLTFVSPLPQAMLTSSPTVVSISAKGVRGVARVKFFFYNPVLHTTYENVLGEDLTAPYSVTWNITSVIEPSYILWAKAYNKRGDVIAESPALEVYADVANLNSVGFGNTERSVPVEGAFLSGTSTVAVAVNGGENYIRDDYVKVAKLELYKDGEPAPFVTSTDFSIYWLRLSMNTRLISDGLHTLIVKAYDDKGNSLSSAPVQVIIDNTPPAVTMVSPRSGTKFASASDMEVSAHASDEGSGVLRVDFYYEGNILFANDSTTPYGVEKETMRYLQLSKGTHALYAQALDRAGNRTDSIPVTVIIE